MNARPMTDTFDRPTLHLQGAPMMATLPVQAGIPVHDARNLTGRTGQAQILLDGQVYALRITRAGKLILTK